MAFSFNGFLQVWRCLNACEGLRGALLLSALFIRLIFDEKRGIATRQTINNNN